MSRIYIYCFFFMLCFFVGVHCEDQEDKSKHSCNILKFKKKKSGNIKVKLKKIEIPQSWVDDNYCDCIDGSDEPNTSACSFSEYLNSTFSDSISKRKTFHCVNDNIVLLNKYLYPSMVNDGVCDCCDGSDEKGSPCPNTCADEAYETISLKKIKVEHLGIALKKKKDLLLAVPGLLQTLNVEISAQISKINEEEASLKSIYENLQGGSEEKRMFQYQYDRFMRKKRSLMQKDKLLYIATTQLKEIQENKYSVEHENLNDIINDYLFGTKLELFNLFSNCYRLLWPKRHYGETGMVEEIYIMEICPFFNATQYSEKHFRMFELRNIEKDIDDDVNIFNNFKNKKLEVFEGGSDNSELQDIANQRYSLGFFSGWKPKIMNSGEVYENKNNPPQLSTYKVAEMSQMRFENGDSCWKGPDRNVGLVFKCGPQNKLVDINENGICSYEFEFETPSACNEEDYDFLASNLKLMVDELEELEFSGIWDDKLLSKNKKKENYISKKEKEEDEDDDDYDDDEEDDDDENEEDENIVAERKRSERMKQYECDPETGNCHT